MINVIPTPRNVKKFPGSLITCDVSVSVDSDADKRVISAAAVLRMEIEALCGSYVPLSCSKTKEGTISIAHGDSGEGYRLVVRENSVTLHGDGAEGAFYGIQTLRQLIKANGLSIPCCEIDDAPDFAYRGYYHDISRGRVCKLETLKKVVDMLSYFKVNSYQLYIEAAFTFKELEGITDSDNALTPEEILELDDYCYNRFVDLVPSLSTFGHLFTLLQSEKYCDISELGHHKMTRNYWLERQWHHTVDVYNPRTIEVIGSMLEQYIPLFRSKYFNICCDETLDLCSGKNAGKDKSEAYFHHLDKLIRIIKSHSRIPMIWGDECMAKPEMAKERVPGDTVILNWCYHKHVNEWIPKFYSDLGFTQVVCPGTSGWDNFVENIDISTGNIAEFAAHAKKYGALGMLNTCWGDFGHVCSFKCNMYGVLFGAQKSWNVDAMTDTEFEKAATLLLYDIKDFNMADVLRKLAEASDTCSWSNFVIWHSAVTIEGKEEKLRVSDKEDYDAAKGIHSIELCKEAIVTLTAVGSGDSRIRDLIIGAKAIELMNKEYLYVNKAEGFGDGDALQAEFDEWLEEYSAAWSEDCKPSDLGLIQDFIKKITKI